MTRYYLAAVLFNKYSILVFLSIKLPFFVWFIFTTFLISKFIYVSIFLNQEVLQKISQSLIWFTVPHTRILDLRIRMFYSYTHFNYISSLDTSFVLIFYLAHEYIHLKLAFKNYHNQLLLIKAVHRKHAHFVLSRNPLGTVSYQNNICI